MHNELLLMLAVISGILALATVTGLFLCVFGGDDVSGVIQNANARIRGWWWIVFVLGGAVLAGPMATILLFAVISFLALREFLALTVVTAVDHRAVVLCFLIVLPAQYLLIGIGRYDWFVGALPILGALLIPVLIVFMGEERNYLARTAELLAGLAVCIYGISCVPALLMLRISGYQDRQVLLMVFLILVSQASDVLQYVWGKLAGRHKIAPAISPSKTVEGFVGGIASATALGASLWWMTPFTAVQAGVMAFIVALFGFLGGLVMSAIKRDRGLKDWSRLIPGHGGMLDRMDSLCFSAPVFFHVTCMFFDHR